MQLEDMSNAELIALVKRQEQELATSVGVTAAELSCVINWLEGGRDPKDAAKELRLYCERAWTRAQPVARLPKWIDDQKGSDPNTDALIEYIEQMRGDLPVQQPAAVAMQEPERFDNKQSREYLVRFMEQNFTDKTYHRYIRAERVGNNLAGDFAWQMARALRIIQAAPVAAPVAANNPEMPDSSNSVEFGGIKPLPNTPAEALKELAALFYVNVECSRAEHVVGMVEDALQPVQKTGICNDGGRCGIGGYCKNCHTVPNSGRDAALVSDEELPGMWETADFTGGDETDTPSPGDLVGWLRTYAGDSGYRHNDYADVMRNAADEIERLAAHPANVAQVGEEQIITQRDAFRDVADNLANAIAAHFGVDIGEHSSANCPWDEALRVIEEAGQVGELSADVILGYAREVGILGPVSDGNALKYARLVLAAAKKSPAT